MQKRNEQKAQALYGCIDEHADFFRCPIEQESRSSMNVVFRLPSEELEKKFLAEANTQQMYGTKGHRSVGGVRISMYNATSPEHINELVGFMTSFKTANS